MAVADNWWLAAAFCCTTSSSWLTPTLISRIAVICSCDATAISWMRFDVSRIIGTVRSSRPPAFSATATLFLARSLICCAACLTALGELADLAGHDGKALAVRPGSCRLDGRVQGQQISLVGDVVDDQDLLGDHAHGDDRFADRFAPLFGLRARLVGHPRRVASMLGVAPDRRIDRLQTTGNLLERGRLLG